MAARVHWRGEPDHSSNDAMTVPRPTVCLPRWTGPE